MTTSTTSAKRSAPFERSAQYYDIIHSRKDYAREAAIFAHHLRRFDEPNAPRLSLIDWGCGTGNFIDHFTRSHNFNVHGVEPSPAMQAMASRKGFDVVRGKIGDDIGGQIYDAACCLFSTFGYATANANPTQLADTLDSIRVHLRKGGRFVFDVLNVAGVVKGLERNKVDQWPVNGTGVLIRRMWREFDVEQSVLACEIEFEKCRRTSVGLESVDNWQESHRMRAFTPRELDFILRRCGFKPVVMFNMADVESYESGRVFDSTWYFAVVAEAE